MAVRHTPYTLIGFLQNNLQVLDGQCNGCKTKQFAKMGLKYFNTLAFVILFSDVCRPVRVTRARARLSLHSPGCGRQRRRHVWRNNNELHIFIVGSINSQLESANTFWDQRGVDIVHIVHNRGRCSGTSKIYEDLRCILFRLPHQITTNSFGRLIKTRSMRAS